MACDLGVFTPDYGCIYNENLDLIKMDELSWILGVTGYNALRPSLRQILDLCGANRDALTNWVTKDGVRWRFSNFCDTIQFTQVRTVRKEDYVEEHDMNEND
jgi:hypothetical protein